MTPVRKLPGPRGHWLVGVLPRLRSDMLGFFEQCFREHGDAAYFRAGNRRSMLLSHPDDIERVLVTENRHFIKNYALQFLRPLMGRGLLLNEGADWLRQRRLVQPAFSKSRIESYAPAMTGATDQLLAEWRPGQTRDVVQDMVRLTMDIAGRTLLDLDVTGQFAVVSQALESVMYDVMGRFGSALPLPYWFPTPRNLRLRWTIARLDRTLQQLITERRAAPGGSDFLSILIAARDEDDGQGLSDKQLRDEVMTMFLAGHETTANTLSWTWFLLGQHPQVLRRVRDEARSVLGGRTPTAADVPKLVFCEHVLREALRLYPPAYVVGRRPLEDITIGNHFIPAGTNVLMSQWIVHRDERWYDRPHDFNPDRWSDGWLGATTSMHHAPAPSPSPSPSPSALTPSPSAVFRPKYAYFPFGGGPRVCIGNTFAMFEATLVLAQIAQRYELAPVTQPPVKIHPAITLRPGQPIEMRIV